MLSRGLISGHWTKAPLGQTDFRRMSPRFQGENLDQNLALVEALRKVAEAKGVSIAQIAIAWVAAQGEDIVPLIGARRARPAGGGAGRARRRARRRRSRWRSSRPCRRTPPPATATTPHGMAMSRQRAVNRPGRRRVNTCRRLSFATIVGLGLLRGTARRALLTANSHGASMFPGINRSECGRFGDGRGRTREP